MRLGVFGGTFDPIHVGHLILAEAAREQLRLDKVSFIPAGDPWRKAGQVITPAPHRLAMVRLAIADNPAFQLDEREVVREGPSYTIDTLRELQAGLSAADELYLIVGEDALADMPNWRDPAAIAAAARIAVAPRAGAALPTLPFPTERLIDVEMPLIAISATELRWRARLGLSLRYQVPDTVAAYVRDHRLYRD